LSLYLPFQVASRRPPLILFKPIDFPCQPLFYLRLSAYSFIRLSEGA
jgi:hypothetical protein